MESSSAKPGTKLDDLPESCISAILSFTTPRDACRFATLCKLFRTAVCSDSVWDKWLPPHYQQNLPTPLHFSCKKELYFHLCNPILMDGGTKMFWLERPTAKVCYMLSARELSIAWGDDDRHWSWLRDASTSISSRFEEVALLKEVALLEVRGEFDSRLLSANTEYLISFLIKFGPRALMWNVLPVKFGVKTAEGDWKECGRLLKEREGASVDPNMRIAPLIERNDGWLEIVAGEFTTKENWGLEGTVHFVEFWMEEAKSGRWKKGLFLDGVIIKPKSI